MKSKITRSEATPEFKQSIDSMSNEGKNNVDNTLKTINIMEKTAEEILKNHFVKYYRKEFPQQELSDDDLYRKVHVFYEEEKAIIAAMEEYASQLKQPDGLTAQGQDINTMFIHINTIFIYAKDGDIKVLPFNHAKIDGDKLLNDGWKHTATIDPCRFIDNILNLEDIEDLADEFYELGATKMFKQPSAWISVEDRLKDVIDKARVYNGGWVFTDAEIIDAFIKTSN